MNNLSNVFVVDDDAAVRDSLRMMLKAAGYSVATFPDADAFLAICNSETSGCIILDVNMPEMSGPELQEELKRRGVKLPIIFLTGQGSIPISVKAMKAGALDFLTKPVNGIELLACVKLALEKSSKMKKLSSEAQIVSKRLENLTEREKEIMKLVIQGLTSKQIAAQINISYRTVENYRANIMHKTGATNIIELSNLSSHNQ